MSKNTLKVDGLASRVFSKKRAPYMFLAPFMILFAIFGIYPIGYSIVISFFEFRLSGAPPDFVGFKNYVNLFATDPFFVKTLYNTFILLIFGSVIQHPIAIPIAILLNNKVLRGREFFKAVYFLPYITSTVSIVLIFSQLFDYRTGWLNYILTDWLGLEEGIRWLTDPVAIKASLAIMLNWKFIGWNTIIYLAGLQAIPQTLYEAARIDGASSFRSHISITLPLLLPIIFFGITLSIIGGMQIFDEPFILLGGYEGLGGAGNSGLTTAFYLLYTAFNVGRLGKASAIAWILFMIIISLTLINRFVVNRLEKSRAEHCRREIC